MRAIPARSAPQIVIVLRAALLATGAKVVSGMTQLPIPLTSVLTVLRRNTIPTVMERPARAAMAISTLQKERVVVKLPRLVTRQMMTTLERQFVRQENFRQMGSAVKVVALGGHLLVPRSAFHQAIIMTLPVERKNRAQKVRRATVVLQTFIHAALVQEMVFPSQAAPRASEHTLDQL